MTKGNLKIHSENILPIIKKWLYSDKDIFLRELVSNACDALSKLKILREQGEVDFKDEDLAIHITSDSSKKTLTISDTGIGMTSDEVEKYIAQLAFSGAEEFVSKYQSSNEKDQIIGHFGLGFYSAFMVSSLVEINTLSYQKEAASAFWSCDGSSEYTLNEGSRTSRGTDIILHMLEDSEEFLEEVRLKELLRKYCSFLPFPIYLNGTHLNDQKPLWMLPPAECSEQDYLELYRYLYPMQPDPIFWIHLHVDYPFHLQGILYFPKITKRFDYSLSNIHLYCNRVFVSDSCKDVIPEYLTVLRGVIDSPDIPLNVSRSSLQMDRTVKQLGTHISKKVTDKLSMLHQSDFTKYSSYWRDIETIIKLGALQDEKFYDRVKDCLIWKNTLDEWTTLKDYLERVSTKHANKVFYSLDEKHTSHFLDLYKNKGLEVLFAHSYLDTPLMSLIESKESPVKFQRIDGGLDDSLLDISKENTLLDVDGKTQGTRLAEFFKQKLDQSDVEIEAKSLASEHLPAFIVFDEQSRRMRDYLSMTQPESDMKWPQKKTLVLNTNSKLIRAIYKLKEKDEA
ncbi:MAG: molecular chaperone HtpG, partial [Chlamydiae bacterium]|nr:molecular chaperone HtpG [Chlamydiota bacterium]